MDLSILSGDTMEFGDDDSFLFIRPEEMDDEVTQIFKKWKLNNPTLPKKDEEIIAPSNVNRNETFDTRTFTRPPKRRTFVSEQQVGTPPKTNMTENDMQSIESGIASINLQVGGAITPLSMQKSWLLDVSPPSSICTSMDFQNCDNMLNSLITSSDFTNVSFLLNGTDAERRNLINNNNTIVLDKNATLIANNPANLTRNLMDFTFNVPKKPSNSTFVRVDSEPPIKEIGIENADIQLSVSTEDFGKNLTFNKYEGDSANMSWDKIQQIHSTVVQSTPIHNANNETHDVKLKKNFDDDTLSPISSFHAQLDDDAGVVVDDENVVNGEVLVRSMKSRRLIDQIRLDEYRNSMEDQCEFLLNEETIKLSSRVYGGETFDCLDENALKNVTQVVEEGDDDEREFDKMLASFSVKKSVESEKLLQSVDSIKQRHSLINMEKQREDKKQRDSSESDNRAQYDTMTKSGGERLLNRRSRLYDDFNSQLQKQQQQNGNAENDSTVANGAENHAEVVVDKNDRDRFKTIKLNKPRLSTGMVIIDTEEPAEKEMPRNEVSPGTNKERQNQINQQKQEEVDKDFKKPAPVSKLSKFGYGLARPSYSSRSNLNLPLKANSTDSLDNDSESFKPIPPAKRPEVSNLKSPMGIKSKSIHNLMYGAQQSRVTSNLKLISSEVGKSQSNLKVPRASSLVRPVSSVMENGYKLPQNENLKSANPASRKTTLMRPSSGYYGNGYTSKKLDSDSESYSLSSSSASSRNSVHLSLAPSEPQFHYQKSTEDLKKSNNISGAIPKPIAARPVASGLPRPSLNGLRGIPRPRR